MAKHNFKKLTSAMALALAAITSGCSNQVSPQVDTLIINGEVYLGDGSGAQSLDIGICRQVICAISPSGSQQYQATRTIDASGHVVSPGFIDPHTHTLAELESQDKNANVNYLMQGVTTVVNGNDGGSPIDIAKTAKALEANGIGTNVAFFIGHNSVRTAVMGRENRYSSDQEIAQMVGIVDKAMQDGALGLSSGLYYVPGSYAKTEEVIALAKAASAYGGIYDTHLRDESTFNIGFANAVDEAINIAKAADIHLHIAHIKALGVDVWGESTPVIKQIEQAQQQGVSISADQYPWLASGTNIRSAIMPKWALAGNQIAFFHRLKDKDLLPRIRTEIAENIRRRGGANALLITEFHSRPNLVGKTLEEIATEKGKTPVDTAIDLVQLGRIRVASFNMSPNDLNKFVVQPWVVTSSDGTNGHPRKYGSFPKKYQDMVIDKKLLSIEDFIIKSASQTADILGLKDRGKLEKGLAADIIVWDASTFKSNATFQKWNVLASGVDTVLVNGQVVVENGEYNQKLAGQYVRKSAN
ncbi:N-acyl-D-amino-acid deacylase family protein [Thalassotalea montiporae]